ncbi:DNA gyrase inhibitor YacG [Falsiroseomonas tokyonensis]|uniref:DNA gyrase inhibitor YacG n=1 Tax=Falsiroseomonas tokyonensis TaxID=430521 RepID=A0ABV7BRQ2_9PROT|nr:DNA gyrase inhibitor YacG [Falsiroseomonas tokyonensis]MBU8538304.1 DNA gyrase inhibitor YacG [Falsiroseomonas tokyonensis]
MKEPDAKPPRARRCPICSKPLEASTARFCSDRCANVDLGRWLRGHYAIPVREPEDPEAES